MFKFLGIQVSTEFSISCPIVLFSPSIVGCSWGLGNPVHFCLYCKIALKNISKERETRFGIQKVERFSRSRDAFIGYNAKKKDCQEIISWPGAKGEQNQLGRWKWGMRDTGIHSPPERSKVKIITRQLGDEHVMKQKQTAWGQFLKSLCWGKEWMVFNE